MAKVRCAYRADCAAAVRDFLVPRRSTLLAVDIFAGRQGVRIVTRGT